MQSVGKLVHAINELGARNISKLARAAGLPVETTRYTIVRRFPQLGLRIQLYPDYHRLGMRLYSGELDLAPRLLGQAKEILAALGEDAYLVYCSTRYPRPRFGCLFAIPLGLETKVSNFLDKVRELGVMRRYRLQPLSWRRRVSLDPSYFDFLRGRWNLDWHRIRRGRPLAIEPMLSVQPVPRPRLDPVDMVIVKELELDATQHVATMARKLGMSRRALQYHYQSHLPGMLPQFIVRWVASPSTAAQTVLLETWFVALAEAKTKHVRQVFARLPFLVFEAGNEEGFYQTISLMPQEALLPSLEYLQEELGEVAAEIEYAVSRPFTGDMAFTIPAHLFDIRAGWQFDERRLLGGLLPYVSGTALAKKGGRVPH